MASDWEELVTDDGLTYYFNAKLQVTQWDKPEEMMTTAERADAKADFIWVTHSEHAWLPAEILSELSGGALKIREYESKAVRTVKKKEIGPRIARIKDLATHTQDLVQLTE